MIVTSKVKKQTGIIELIDKAKEFHNLVEEVKSFVPDYDTNLKKKLIITLGALRALLRVLQDYSYPNTDKKEGVKNG